MFNRITLIFVSLLLTVLSPSIATSLELITTDGGLQVQSKNYDYWFKLSGVIKVDQRTYFGDTNATASPWTNAGTYNTGAFVRDAGLTLNGGVGKNYTYTLGLNFDAKNSLSRVDDAYVTYHGFQDFMPNFTFDIGQVIPGFCLTCATSSKWIPFLERSMGTNTFGPQQGMGINFLSFDNNYTWSVTITQQPKTGQPILSPQNRIVATHDLWQFATRVDYRPIYQPGHKTLQFGLSWHIQEYSNNGVRFNPNPEMKSGSTVTLLDTAVLTGPSNSINASPSGRTLIAAKNQNTIDAAMLWIYNSWSGELEYQRAYIARGKDYVTSNTAKQGPNLKFTGYHAQVSYVLTGEVRPLKLATATLGQIMPRNKCGAWEVSARYSFINLNNGDIFGGVAHNTSGSLAWYINDNLKAIGEYVYSAQQRFFPATSAFGAYLDKRDVSSVGLRLQVVF